LKGEWEGKKGEKNEQPHKGGLLSTGPEGRNEKKAVRRAGYGQEPKGGKTNRAREKLQHHRAVEITGGREVPWGRGRKRR